MCVLTVQFGAHLKKGTNHLFDPSKPASVIIHKSQIIPEVPVLHVNLVVTFTYDWLMLKRCYHFGTKATSYVCVPKEKL